MSIWGTFCGSDPQDHVIASKSMAVEHRSEDLNLRRVFKRVQSTNFLSIPNTARLTSSEQNSVCHLVPWNMGIDSPDTDWTCLLNLHSQAVYSTVPHLVLTSSPPEVSEHVCILHESVRGNGRDLSQVFPGVTIPTSNSCQSQGYLGSVLFCFLKRWDPKGL